MSETWNTPPFEPVTIVRPEGEVFAYAEIGACWSQEDAIGDELDGARVRLDWQPETDGQMDAALVSLTNPHTGELVSFMWPDFREALLGLGLQVEAVPTSEETWSLNVSNG